MRSRADGPNVKGVQSSFSLISSIRSFVSRWTPLHDGHAGSHSMTSFQRLRTHARNPGQGMVEYGLILVLVAVVAIAGLVVLGPRVASVFTSIGSSV